MPAHYRDSSTPEPPFSFAYASGDAPTRPRHAAPDPDDEFDPHESQETPTYDGGVPPHPGAAHAAGEAREPGERPEPGEVAEPGDVPDGEVSPAAAPGFDLEEYLEHTEVSILEPRYRVSPKAPIAWTLESMWSIIILIALQVGWYFWGDNVMAFWNWVAAAATAWIGFFSLVVAPTWRYMVARWDFSETAVFAKSGWWTHQYRIAPLGRLQTVYTKRSMFERMLGLASVVASTASAHGSVEIKGLPLADAETLADHLLKIAELDEGDAT
ncbi:MAG TPA: PH domain-containing protein [Dietzia timorensis]|uniref:PH domain-containing protein n=1 Tax=Dietzia timorensis TaxID=499555 RepID=A0A921F4D9_9ACTN|nr:PH domain-containing protein [Dietzia timorensis]HJE90383.1 PH domain-containing protein [Dietzia timorensis]